ncbi:small ribosomal subunit protein bS21m-like [Antedon mediterranea]|uniref:small ribosomal subunit protein bS21m-like n=1 Tax=Antedon mediterranea TaxID=105859 RepID=UPI003AF52BE2
MARHLKFVARTVFVQNGEVDAAYRTLNSILFRDGIIDTVKRGRYYEKPCQKRRRLQYENVKRIYNQEMTRKVNFIMKKNRTDPWPI